MTPKTINIAIVVTFKKGMRAVEQKLIINLVWPYHETDAYHCVELYNSQRLRSFKFILVDKAVHSTARLRYVA